MEPSVGIVIPAYRPSPDRLVPYVEALDATLDPVTIRVELDAPEPGVEAALADLPVTVNAVSERRGKGSAVTAGFEALDADVLSFADADGSTPAESVADVVGPVASGRVDLSVGSRRHPDADVRSHQTLARRRLGDGFAWFARRLLDVRLYDYQCGAKAISTAAWRRVRGHLYEPGFAWDLELVAMAGALDLDVAEIPVTWEDQPESTVAPVGTALELAVALFATRHRARLLGDDRLHVALDTARERPPALVDRLAEGADEQ